MARFSVVGDGVSPSNSGGVSTDWSCMFLFDTDKAQAVLFFGRDSIVRELLYPELEALLDGYVPIEEWANTTQKAVYVEFNKDFIPVAAVFFVMAFDARGAVEGSWNLPLLDMARTRSRGPDLGAGPIHLVCASQCPMVYFKDWMWDPDLNPQGPHFQQVLRALKRNRLGVHFRTVQVEDTGTGFSAKDLQRLEVQISKQYEQTLREQMTQLLESHDARMKALAGEKDQAFAKLRSEFERKFEEMRALLEEKEAALRDLEQRNHELRTTVDGQVQKIEGLRDYYEHKLRRVQGTESETLDAVKTRLEAQWNSRLAEATSELTELLKMREVELLYRKEHEEQLRQEIDRLRRSQQESQANSGDQFLEKLSRRGVNFVTYQPGAGHITIPHSELNHFLDSPTAFTASYCGVGEKLYQDWLKHYQMPVCSAVDETGEACCADVPRVVNPADFIPGTSDRCEQHAPGKKSGKLKAV
jgi:hypothetical protein